MSENDLVHKNQVTRLHSLKMDENGRADRNGLWIESRWRSEAGTCMRA